MCCIALFEALNYGWPLRWFIKKFTQITNRYLLRWNASPFASFTILIILSECFPHKDIRQWRRVVLSFSCLCNKVLKFILYWLVRPVYTVLAYRSVQVTPLSHTDQNTGLYRPIFDIPGKIYIQDQNLYGQILPFTFAVRCSPFVTVSDLAGKVIYI